MKMKKGAAMGALSCLFVGRVQRTKPMILKVSSRIG